MSIECPSVEEASWNLINAIKTSEIYLEYVKQKDEVDKDPALKAKLYEFRQKNFEIQTNGNTELEMIEQLEHEYGDFLEQPIVRDFLAAELDFCRMIQEINLRVAETIDFE